MANMLNFFTYIIEGFKASIRYKIATFLIIAGLGIILGYTFDITLATKDKFFSIMYNNTFGIVETVIMFIFLLIGLLMMIDLYLKDTKKSTVLFYSLGIPNMNIHSPENAVPARYRLNFDNRKESINSYDKNTVKTKIAKYKEYFESRFEDSDTQKIYVAALGGFPYLFLLGMLFRNGYSKVEVLDFKRFDHEGKWYALDRYSDSSATHKLLYEQGLTIENEIERIKTSSNSEAAIALAYTFPIEKDRIPAQLKNDTLFLKNSLGIGHDKLSNHSLQNDLLQELSYYLGSIGNRKEKIHLFVSAQASMCINIGKILMDNGHPNIIVHNYNVNSRSYDWSLSVNEIE